MHDPGEPRGGGERQLMLLKALGVLTTVKADSRGTCQVLRLVPQASLPGKPADQERGLQPNTVSTFDRLHPVACLPVLMCGAPQALHASVNREHSLRVHQQQLSSSPPLGPSSSYNWS